ncbi:hypothetical protein [Haloglycomyces albus]|uniref:hypothetical protein n=1 Tax=Haloglycomyces albus TaxID=526067 RepID=UPI0012EC2FA6|nr:hypothetical protein [Haloglycomyces albus]
MEPSVSPSALEEVDLPAGNTLLLNRSNQEFQVIYGAIATVVAGKHTEGVLAEIEFERYRDRFDSKISLEAFIELGPFGITSAEALVLAHRHHESVLTEPQVDVIKSYVDHLIDDDSVEMDLVDHAALKTIGVTLDYRINDFDDRIAKADFPSSLSCNVESWSEQDSAWKIDRGIVLGIPFECSHDELRERTQTALAQVNEMTHDESDAKRACSLTTIVSRLSAREIEVDRSNLERAVEQSLGVSDLYRKPVEALYCSYGIVRDYETTSLEVPVPEAMKAIASHTLVYGLPRTEVR